MSPDLSDWAKKHLDDGVLKNDIMYPSAELDLVVKELVAPLVGFVF